MNKRNFCKQDHDGSEFYCMCMVLVLLVVAGFVGLSRFINGLTACSSAHQTILVYCGKGCGYKIELDSHVVKFRFCNNDNSDQYCMKCDYISFFVNHILTLSFRDVNTISFPRKSSLQ